MTKLGFGLLAGTSLLSVATFSSPVFAQAQQPQQAQSSPENSAATDTAAADITEIIVLARKRAERLSRVPETIQAFTADTIARAGISSLNSLGQQVPNVVLNRRMDNEPNVVIRGVGSFGNTQGVGFYIDDVQNFTDQSAVIEDVERIEVLKGPQGTLYGGSNVGGAVKYIMKQPGPDFGAEARAEYGTFNTLNLFGAVNAPLVHDGSLAVRVSGYFNRSDGYIYNTPLGMNDDKSRDLGLRLAFKWQLSDRATVRFSYRHSYLSNGGNPYVHADNVRDYHRTIDDDVDTYNHRTVDGAILQVDYDLQDVTATSITSYTHKKTHLLWDVDSSAADVAVIFTGDRDGTSVFTQELRLASATSGPYDFIAGGYFSRIANRSPLDSTSDLLLGVGAGGPLLIKGFFNAPNAERQYALFGTANYDLGPLKIGGGVRLSRSEFEANLHNLVTGPAHRSTASTHLLPKVSLAYDVAPDVMVYVNAALGMEPGRINLTSDTGDSYRPEKALSYEVGLKGITLQRRLSFDVAGFYIDYRDRQQEELSNIKGVVVEQIFNVGDSRSWGIEGSLSYRATKRLTFSLSGGYLDATWRNGTYIFPLAEGEVPVEISVHGRTVPFSPKYSGTASLDWHAPLGSLELGFRGDVTHKGSLYWDIPNQAKAAPYQLMNLRLSLGDPAKKWEFAVRAENLFGVHYFNEFQFANYFPPDANGNCDGCHASAPGSPRRLLASIRTSF